MPGLGLILADLKMLSFPTAARFFFSFDNLDPCFAPIVSRSFFAAFLESPPRDSSDFL